ncbi:HAD family hydrolase [Paraoerskovia marina]|uniref:HAD family hydrolase n=1 Tax=Paraoerskovia marina TaxID=545619 RepID=UPI000492B6A7|nr:HAD family hydrolase [Paraoerskovia marina]
MRRGFDEVEAVVFDLDDTLVDTKVAFAAAIGAVATTYLPHLPADRHPEVVATWRADVSGRYRAYTRGELSFDAQRMLRANELQLAFGGVELDDAAYARWRDAYSAAFRGAWVAHDDAAPALQELVRRGFRVGVLTNAAREMQVEKIARTGLADLVPLLVAVDDLGVGKPDPRVFHEACRLLGTEHARTVYVGDELDVDARGAIAAGLHGVWIDRPGARRGGPHPEDPEAARASGVTVISSLADLTDALRR